MPHSVRSSTAGASIGSISNFTVQSQETVLEQASIRSLKDLRSPNNANYSKFKDHLTNAINIIASTALQMNDRGGTEHNRHLRKKRRLAVEEDDDEGIEDDFEQYEAMQTKIDLHTKKLDLGVRKMIDDRTWLENVPAALDHVISKSNAALVRAANLNREGRDDEGSEDDNVDDNYSTAQPDPSETPATLLHAAFSTHQTAWSLKTPTERYAHDNDYKGFYRSVFEGKHQTEDAPPMPHANQWFAAEEGRDVGKASRNTQRARNSEEIESTQEGMVDAQSDSGSDIEIQAEKIRITCPITLLPFEDPVQSTKCPHAYEKRAILDMFRTSTEFFPLSPNQIEELAQLSHRDRSKAEHEMKVKMVKCPECTFPLSQQDLRPDPLLLRKVKRALERQRREEEFQRLADDDLLDEEDDASEDDIPRGTQRRKIVNIGSSPTRSVRASARKSVKNERTRESVVPQTQFEDDEDSN